jgi:hypothetical protein
MFVPTRVFLFLVVLSPPGLRNGAIADAAAADSSENAEEANEIRGKPAAGSDAAAAAVSQLDPMRRERRCTMELHREAAARRGGE